MPAGDLLREAITTLYRADFDDFIPLRTALAAQARRSGDKAAAQEIAQLKKPTRSAWIVNRLVHTDPEAPTRLAELAIRLRAAERALDGSQMRALTSEKNRLLDELTRAASASARPARPSASLLEEVTSTLAAALADPAVADSLRAGTLVRAASWSGFGVAGPELTLVPAARPARSRPAAAPKVQSGRAPADAHPHADAPAETDAHAREAAERRRSQQREALAAAQQALDTAQRAVATAEAEYSRLQERIEQLSSDLQRAREDASAATRAVRAARAHRQSARQLLRRLPT